MTKYKYCITQTNDHVQRELYNDTSVYFYLIKFYSEHNTHGPTSVSVWHRLHCYSTGLIYIFVLYVAYIARNAMPKKISTKCNVFLQLIILRPHPHFTRHVRKKSAKPSAFYTIENPQVRRSANPHFTRGLPHCIISRSTATDSHCNN